MASNLNPCQLCTLPESLNAISIGKHWTLNIAQDASTRPWLVLQTKRHSSSLSHLEPEEAIELGLIQRNIIRHIESLPGVHRGHIYYLNETIPSHAHIHFTVSTLNEMKVSKEKMLDAVWPNSIPLIPKALWMPNFERLAIEKREPSILVRTLVGTARTIQKINFIYPLISRILVRKNKDSGFAAEIFVSFSLMFFALGLILSGENRISLGIFALLGLFRVIDIWSTQISILLDRRANKLKGFERTLVLAVTNCAELAIISGVWSKYFLNLNLLESLNFGFHVATNRSEIIAPGSIAGISIDMIGTATSLLLLVAVIAMALGRLTSDRFEETLD
jgi:diadenosine tetraphosphate (Ap4A) HIT family hydrolase